MYFVEGHLRKVNQGCDGLKFYDKDSKIIFETPY